MSDVLSQDEIDQLLMAINAGDTKHDDFRHPVGGGKIKIYDFKRPDKFSKEQIRTLCIIHETFARLITTSLSDLLRSVVHVHVASVDQLTYEEFIRSIPTPTTLGVINMDALKGNAVLEIDPVVTFDIIVRLAGGAGSCLKFHHELTYVEQSLMRNVIERCFGCLSKAWVNITDDLLFNLTHLESNPQFIQIVPPNEMVILVTLEAKVGDVGDVINICYPYSTLEGIIDRLSASYWYGDTRASQVDYVLSSRDSIPLKLTAEIIRQRFSLGQIAMWKKGDVVSFICSKIGTRTCFLKLGDKRVWVCDILDERSGSLKLIRVLPSYDVIDSLLNEEMVMVETKEVNNEVFGALSTAPITISVELGSATKTVKEVLSIGEGTIVELDKLAGEPVDIKANGVLIARGEVVVVDENFGVRITEIEKNNLHDVV